MASSGLIHVALSTTPGLSCTAGLPLDDPSFVCGRMLSGAQSRTGYRVCQCKVPGQFLSAALGGKSGVCPSELRSFVCAVLLCINILIVSRQPLSRAFTDAPN